MAVRYPNGASTGKWVQFFSHVFKPEVDYVELVLKDQDRADRKKRALNARRLRKEIEARYRDLSPASGKRMAQSAFEKVTLLSKSRILQYFYALFESYSSQPK